MRHPATLLLVPLLLLNGCGSGGGSGDANNTTGATGGIQSVTRYYASGRIQETGEIITANGKRSGIWTAYHDVDGSPLRFTGDYTDDRLDVTKPWREWNADGSIRLDAGDR